MKLLCALVAAFLSTGSFTTLLCRENAFFYDGLLLVFVFAAVAFLLHRGYSKLRGARIWIFSQLLGLLLSALTAFGFSIERQGYVAYNQGSLWLAIALWSHVYAVLLGQLWLILEQGESKLSKEPEGRLQKGLDWFLRKPPLVFLVILLLWMPCFISIFPGNFVYDATKEFQQLETGYLGDFPLLHSVLINKLLVWSMETTGGYNRGIAVFTFSQMVLLAAAFTHMVYRFRKLGGNPVAVMLLLLYWAAFPAVHLLVTSTVRDVLFSGLLCYSVFLLWLMCRDVKGFLGSWWKSIGPAAVLVLTIFSRNNNTGSFLPYALGAVCLLLFVIGGKHGWRGALVFTVVAVGCFCFLQSNLNKACPEVKEPSARASMTVYSQSLVRAYMEDGKHWTEDEQRLMRKYFNLKDLRYVPENGDSTKGRLKVETPEEKAEFLEFWKQMGEKYPQIYADAILANTRSMWMPGVVMDGYQEAGIGLYKPYEKCYFYFADHIEDPGILENHFSKVHDWYQELALMISFEEVPVFGLLFSVGFQFWLVLVALFYAMYRKCRDLYLPLGVLVGYSLISACVPLMLLRYFGALIFAFPIVALFLLQPRVGKLKNKKE